jgi:hypothetical protein
MTLEARRACLDGRRWVNGDRQPFRLDSGNGQVAVIGITTGCNRRAYRVI